MRVLTALTPFAVSVHVCGWGRGAVGLLSQPVAADVLATFRSMFGFCREWRFLPVSRF